MKLNFTVEIHVGLILNINLHTLFNKKILIVDYLGPLCRTKKNYISLF